MFDQGRFNVKIIVQGLKLYDCIACPFFNFLRVGDILKLLCTDVKYDESICNAYV